MNQPPLHPPGHGPADAPPQPQQPPSPPPPPPQQAQQQPPQQQSGGYRYQPQSRVIRAAETKVLNESAAFLAESQKAATAIREEAQIAYENAKRTGYEDGKREGASEATKVVMETSIRLQTELAALETSLADIAMESIEKVLGQFEHMDLVRRAVHAAIMERQHEWALTFRVVPGRVEEIKTLIRDIMGPQMDVAVRAVEGDAQLRPDSIVIISPFGAIEVGIEQQLKALREILGASGLAANNGYG